MSVEKKNQGVPRSLFVQTYAGKDDMLAKEFEELDASRGLEAKGLVYVPPKGVMEKNRYVDVLPSIQHRVKLENPKCDYINACFFKSNLPGSTTEYIIAQAPLPDVVPDFMEMIWEQEISVVLMLTKEIEKNLRKADKYWPNAILETEKYGDFNVKLYSQKQEKAFWFREIKIQKQGKEERLLDHVQYTAWPDQGVPQEYDDFVQLLAKYRSFKPQNSKVLVHCSAGIGRSGVFALVDSVLNMLASTQEDVNINLKEVVKHMRTYRPGAIQNAAQYIYCFKFISYCIEKNLFDAGQKK